MDVTIEDVDNLRELFVRTGEIDHETVGDALQERGFGSLDGEHAWLQIAALRAGGPDTDDWRRQFDGMVAYASGKGWVSPDGAAVRAHLEAGRQT